LFVSGGNRDLVYRYSWHDNKAALVDSIPLGPAPDSTGGRQYPAGLACSGNVLYVAENLSDSLAVVDVAAKQVRQKLAVGPYPYAVTVTMDRRVFVSSWGGSWVSEFIPGRHGLDLWHRIRVGRHPSAILMSPGNLRLYATSAASDQIAVVNMVTRGMPDLISDAAPGAPSEGSTPNALAFSPSGDRLYVAEADNNAVAVYSTQRRKAGKLLGR